MPNAPEQVEDLVQGRSHTIGASLVAIAPTRLSEGGDRQYLAQDPELKLYALLQQDQADPYAYYKACC